MHKGMAVMQVDQSWRTWWRASLPGLSVGATSGNSYQPLPLVFVSTTAPSFPSAPSGVLLPLADAQIWNRCLRTGAHSPRICSTDTSSFHPGLCSLLPGPGFYSSPYGVCPGGAKAALVI